MDAITLRIAPFTQQDLVSYGDLHGTNGKIHVDPDFARTAVTKGIVVQGTLVLSAVLDAFRRVKADAPFKGYEVEARFVSMVRLAEAIDLEFRCTGRQAQAETWTFDCRRPGAVKALAGTLAWRI